MSVEEKLRTALESAADRLEISARYLERSYEPVPGVNRERIARIKHYAIEARTIARDRT